MWTVRVRARAITAVLSNIPRTISRRLINGEHGELIPCGVYLRMPFRLCAMERHLLQTRVSSWINEIIYRSKCCDQLSNFAVFSWMDFIIGPCRPPAPRRGAIDCCTVYRDAYRYLPQKHPPQNKTKHDVYCSRENPTIRRWSFLVSADCKISIETWRNNLVHALLSVCLPLNITVVQIHPLIDRIVQIQRWPQHHVHDICLETLPPWHLRCSRPMQNGDI